MGNVLSSLDLSCPDRVRNRYDSQASASRKVSCATGEYSSPLTNQPQTSATKCPTANDSRPSRWATELIAFTTSAAKADVATNTSFHDLADIVAVAPAVFLAPTVQAVEVNAEWKIDEDDPPAERPECSFPPKAGSIPLVVLAPTVRCTPEETVVVPFHFESTPMPVRESLTSAVSKRRGSLPISTSATSNGLVIASPEAKAGLQRLRRRKQMERRRTQSFRETSPRYPIRSGGSADLSTPSGITPCVLASAIAASSAAAVEIAENAPAKVDLLDMDEQLANEERLLEEEFQNLKSQITTPRVPLALQDCMTKPGLFSPTKTPVPSTVRLTTAISTPPPPPPLPTLSTPAAMASSTGQTCIMTPNPPPSTTSSVAHGLELPSPGSTEKENDPRRASLAGMNSPLISLSTPRAFPKPEICAEFKPTPTKFEDCSAAMKQQREEIQARLAARIKASEEHTELLRNLREKDRIIHDLMEQNVLLTRAAVSGGGSGSGLGGAYSGGSGSEGGAVTPSTPSQSNSSTARSLLPPPPLPAFRQGRSKSAELKYRSRERSLSGSRKPTLYCKAKEVEASDEWSEDRSLTEDSHDD